MTVFVAFEVLCFGIAFVCAIVALRNFWENLWRTT